MTPPTFSTSWKSSKRASKQRKYRYNAPAHIRRGFMACHLSKTLRQQYKRRSIPAKTGDKVKVLRGSFSGKTGTIDHTDTTKIAIYITGIERTKRDGSKTLIPIHPSNLLIEELDLKDRRRMNKDKPSSKKPLQPKSGKEKGSATASQAVSEIPQHPSSKPLLPFGAP